MYTCMYIPLQSICLSRCSKGKETFRKVQKRMIAELVISKIELEGLGMYLKGRELA